MEIKDMLFDICTVYEGTKEYTSENLFNQQISC